MRTIIVDLGNPILCDDRVGLAVAAYLEPILQAYPNIDVVYDTCGGLRLMELMIGYDRAVVVDAIVTGASSGSIHTLPADAIASQRSAAAHDVNLATALKLGRQANAHLPSDEKVSYVGIEAADIQTFTEECTDHVAAAIPDAARTILELLDISPVLPECAANNLKRYPIREF